MPTRGAKAVRYERDEDRPVTLSIRVPKPLAHELGERSWKERTTMSALIVEGVYLRLGLPMPQPQAPLQGQASASAPEEAQALGAAPGPQAPEPPRPIECPRPMPPEPEAPEKAPKARNVGIPHAAELHENSAPVSAPHAAHSSAADPGVAPEEQAKKLRERQLGAERTRQYRERKKHQKAQQAPGPEDAVTVAL